MTSPNIALLLKTEERYPMALTMLRTTLHFPTAIYVMGLVFFFFNKFYCSEQFPY